MNYQPQEEKIIVTGVVEAEAQVAELERRLEEYIGRQSCGHLNAFIFIGDELQEDSQRFCGLCEIRRWEYERDAAQAQVSRLREALNLKAASAEYVKALEALYEETRPTPEMSDKSLSPAIVLLEWARRIQVKVAAVEAAQKGER